VPDVHWLSLKPELEGLIFPSKFYGIAAAGRPVIAIAATDGEIAALVRDNDCGHSIAPGDSRTLADYLTALSNDPARCVGMGRRARDMLDTHFTQRMAFARWTDALADVERRAIPCAQTQGDAGIMAAAEF
jgi:glycosyltransferase involved in cell wall biosynthesis